MRIIVGYGNELRGEDAFGVDVIKHLEEKCPEDTKLISTFQLTPELCMDLLEAQELIFIDACYSSMHQYKLGCSIEISDRQNLSHHICPKTIITILSELYNCRPNYKIYSMLTDSFDSIWDKKKYQECVENLSKTILN